MLIFIFNAKLLVIILQKLTQTILLIVNVKISITFITLRNYNEYN